MWFAAGALVSASMLHPIPRAIAMNADAPLSVLAGFFGLHPFNRALTAFVCEKDTAPAERGLGIVPMLGIGFHSFVDGFVYSTALTVGVSTGVVATAGMILHESPEVLITDLLPVRGGFAARTALLLAAGAVAASSSARTSWEMSSRASSHARRADWAGRLWRGERRRR
ncbi:MAG: hypothetical protein JW767_08740 [Thermoleophilia bacterium]|nr:hypothetical protein [Thermoleophilia bacterium]